MRAWGVWRPEAWAARLSIAILAMGVLAMGKPSWAGPIKQTYLGYTLPYAPKATADYLRLNLVDGNPAKAFSDATIDATKSTATITRKVAGKVTLINAPIAQSASQQLPPPGGMVQAKPGFIDFRPAGTTFMPGDLVSFTLYFNGNQNYKTSGGLWRDGNGGNGVNTTIGSAKVAGAGGYYDPSFVISDDLDTTVFAPAGFEIMNLTFLADITSSQLESLSSLEIQEGIFPAGTTQLSTFDLQSSAAGSGGLPSSMTFDNPWPQPAPNLWNVALGQLYDPGTGVVEGFIDGYQGGAVPEPAAWSLMLTGIGVLGAMLRRRPEGAHAPGRRHT